MPRQSFASSSSPRGCMVRSPILISRLRGSFSRKRAITSPESSGESSPMRWKSCSSSSEQSLSDWRSKSSVKSLPKCCRMSSVLTLLLSWLSFSESSLRMTTSPSSHLKRRSASRGSSRNSNFTKSDRPPPPAMGGFFILDIYRTEAIFSISTI